MQKVKYRANIASKKNNVNTSNAGAARNPHPGPLPEGEGGENTLFLLWLLVRKALRAYP